MKTLKVMKHIYSAILSFLMIVSVAGCMFEVLEEPVESPGSVELTAMMEAGPDSKTSLSGLEGDMYYPLWSAEDEIAVFADNDTTPSKFTLISGEGETKASFSGTRSGDSYIALYPYDETASVTDGILSMTLPQTQKYAAGSFGQDAYPMLGRGGSDDVLDFTNLCAVLKISFEGTAAIRSVTLTANDEKTFLSGPATVALNETKAVAGPLEMSDGGSNSVVLDCKGLEISEDSPADVFIAIPAQTYKGGLTIEVDTYADKVTKAITSDLTFARSQIRTIPRFTLDSEVPDLIPEAVPDNQIWYSTLYGDILSLKSSIAEWPDAKFNSNVISNEYRDGMGVITFDAPLTDIDRMAFADKQNLTSIYLPSSLKRIGVNAFFNCCNLEKVVINSTELTIDTEFTAANPFRYCNKLSSFSGPNASEDGRCLIVNNSLYSFAPYEIEEYSIPQGVKVIKDNSFCESTLKVVVIPEGVETIEAHAFSAKSYTDTKIKSTLEYVYLPSTLKYIDGYAFIYNNNIKAFYGNNSFVSDDNMCLIVPNYNGLGYNTIVSFASGSEVTEYTIPAGVQAIESYGFYYATNLKKLNFPDSFEMVFSGCAFEGTTNIETITGKYVLEDGRSMVVDGTLVMLAGAGLEKYVTPKGVSYLGYMVLGLNDDIKEYVISDDVIEVGGYGYVFNQCPNLETVTISARMTYLGYDPFCPDIYSTPSLKTVYCRAVIPPVVYHNTGEYQFDDLTIYVPDKSYDLYMSSSDWAPYREYIEPYDYGDLSEFYPDHYISTDYSQDGKVETLQTATEGNGIDIVLMGDAYSDRQIADGTYEADMKYMYDNLFTKEPFRTHKNMFNVSYVNVVSATEGYEHGNTALSGYFGAGTEVGGNDGVVFNYALNAISEERMDEALIIVAMNSDAYAGTCWMYYPESSFNTYAGDYGSGPSIAYFPKGGDKETFAQLLHHEANGHGFAKLADEYAYESMGTVPLDEMTMTRQNQDNWGWWKNVDFTSDLSAVSWAHFIEDDRYAREGLGAYQGGLTYWSGVWRPTYDSIMRYNVGDFNPPSREAIYYRIHKLAYGDSWEYDYEKFVEYDAVNRSTTASRASRSNYVERALEPTSPPVVVGKSWRAAE